MVYLLLQLFHHCTFLTFPLIRTSIADMQYLTKISLLHAVVFCWSYRPQFLMLNYFAMSCFEGEYDFDLIYNAYITLW